MEAHAIPRFRAASRRPQARHALLSDEQLARLVSAGDERAFTVLYERYHQTLYRYCRSMLRHEADAQDALQSAFAGAYAALQRTQRDAPIRPWLFRIAHNESISVLRRRRPETELAEDSGPLASSVEELGEQRERLTQLVADLRELPKRQRGALVMRELSGLSHEDIALALETSVGGAKQAIFEGRHALLEFVEGRAMGCDEICRLVSDADGRVLRGRRVRAHLRDCAACSAYAAAIPARTADLRALAPPLPAAVAAGLLARVLGSGTAVGGGGAVGVGGGAGLVGTLTGKGATLALATKAVAGLAVVSAATVGITRAVEHQPAVHSPASAVTAPVARSALTTASNHRGAVTGATNTPATTRSGGGRGQAMSSTHGRGKTANPGLALGQLVTPAKPTTPAATRSGGAQGQGMSSTHAQAGTVSGQTKRHSYGNSASQSSSSQSSSSHSSSVQPQTLSPQSRGKQTGITKRGLTILGL